MLCASPHFKSRESLVLGTSYFRVFTTLIAAVAAAAIVALLVAYGSASAQTNPSLLRAGAPTVRSTVPADAATNIDPAANITVRFSERMLKSSINSQTVRLYQGTFSAAQLNPDPNCTVDCPATPVDIGAPVSYVLQKKGKKRIPTAIVDPTNPLRENTAYTLLIEGAADADGLAVKDTGGKEMAQDKIVHFSTGPCVPACG